MQITNHSFPSKSYHNNSYHSFSKHFSFSHSRTNYIYYIFIYIDDTTPLSYEEEGKLVGDYNEYWALKFYNFYKNAKIKKIEVYKEINDKFVNNYRRPSTTAIPVGEPE